STSVEVAVKMALQFWWNQNEQQKTKLLAFKDAYHGDTFGAMSVSGRSIFTQAFDEKLFDVVFIDKPCEENIEELSAFIEAEAPQLAGFIYEPLIQGAGGMLMHEPYYLDQLLSTCNKNNILCIADEVMTGFGRTAKMFASHYMHQQP